MNSVVKIVVNSAINIVVKCHEHCCEQCREHCCEQCHVPSRVPFKTPVLSFKHWPGCYVLGQGTSLSVPFPTQVYNCVSVKPCNCVSLFIPFCFPFEFSLWISFIVENC